MSLTMPRGSTSTSYFPQWGATPAHRDSVSSFSISAPETVHDYFVQMLQSRLEYLDSLHGLPGDWISGESVAPNSAAIGGAKALLYMLGGLVKSLEPEDVPKLVIAPIPSGGLGITIQTENGKFSTSIYNDNSVEFELLTDSYEEETSTLGDQQDVIKRFVRLYVAVVYQVR